MWNSLFRWIISYWLAIAIFTQFSIWSLCEFVIKGVYYNKSTQKCNKSYNELEPVLKKEQLESVELQ